MLVVWMIDTDPKKQTNLPPFIAAKILQFTVVFLASFATRLKDLVENTAQHVYNCVLSSQTPSPVLCVVSTSQTPVQYCAWFHFRDEELGTSFLVLHQHILIKVCFFEGAILCSVITLPRWCCQQYPGLSNYYQQLVGVPSHSRGSRAWGTRLTHQILFKKKMFDSQTNYYQQTHGK
jgi:hypothetical protein